MKVPSEVVEKFYYDVVIQFYPIDITNNTELHIKRYGVKFFSNDPSFVFTYAYVFKNNDMFIEELAPKMSKLALKEKPDQRNPYQIPSYVKSIYFCFLYMQTKSLFNKTHWKNYSSNLVWRNILHDIENADKKIKDRQEKGVEASKTKKLEKDSKKETPRTTKKAINHINSSSLGSDTVNIIRPKKPIKPKGASVTKNRGNIRIINKK
jgi:hypothetical protein